MMYVDHVSIAFFATAVIQITTTMTTAFTIPTQYHHSGRPHHVVIQQRYSSRDSTTRIFLEDWVANMIDGELDRLNDQKKYDAKSMEELKGTVLTRMNAGAAANAGGPDLVGYPSMMMDEDERQLFAEHKRDERMAFTKPEQYCADRFVATGNCDILEDFYELTPESVIQFCEECVLNFDDENDSGCDVPDAFYEKEPPIRP